MAEDKETKVVDLTKREKAWATAEAPYHTEGEEVEAAPPIIEMMVKNKWATKTEPKKKG